MAICLASFGLVGFELGQIHVDERYLQLWEVSVFQAIKMI